MIPTGFLSLSRRKLLSLSVYEIVVVFLSARGWNHGEGQGQYNTQDITVPRVAHPEHATGRQFNDYGMFVKRQ